MNRPLLETIIEIIDKNDFKQVNQDYKAIIHVDESIALLVTMYTKSLDSIYLKINLLVRKENFYYNLPEIIYPITNKIHKKTGYESKFKIFETSICYKDVKTYIYDLEEIDSELVHNEEPFTLLANYETTFTRPLEINDWIKENNYWIRQKKNIFSETEIPYWKNFLNDIENDEDLVGIFINLTLE